MPTEPQAFNPDEKSLALLAHILGFFTGWLGPLILYLTSNEKPFAKNSPPKRSTSSSLCFVFIGFIVLPAVGIVDLIFCILAAVAVSNGQDYRYPFALRLVK
jgi:uncharacterized Tic20 family protein